MTQGSQCVKSSQRKQSWLQAKDISYRATQVLTVQNISIDRVPHFSPSHSSMAKYEHGRYVILERFR